MFDCISAGADAIQTSPGRLKILIFTVKNFTEQKFQVQKNGEKGHFSDPALVPRVSHDVTHDHDWAVFSICYTFLLPCGSVVLQL